mmetsp:Transcript_71574/g.141999  ORF Transcript_71574/g.141999 Transcript_71574/m.141999 type:complete len:202 (+) Transcript_71574:714-1319(+)
MVHNGHFHGTFFTNRLGHFNYFVHIFDYVLWNLAVYIANLDSWYLFDSLPVFNGRDLYNHFLANDMRHFNYFFYVLDVLLLYLLVNPVALDARHMFHEFMNLHFWSLNYALFYSCLWNFPNPFLELVDWNFTALWQNLHAGTSWDFFHQFHLPHCWNFNKLLLKNNLRHHGLLNAPGWLGSVPVHCLHMWSREVRLCNLRL